MHTQLSLLPLLESPANAPVRPAATPMARSGGATPPRFLTQLMEYRAVAEELIDQALAERPEKAVELECLLSMLTPTIEAVPVYRLHVQELIRRVLNGEDLRPGTDAELINFAIATFWQGTTVTDDAGLYIYDLACAALPALQEANVHTLRQQMAWSHPGVGEEMRRLIGRKVYHKDRVITDAMREAYLAAKARC